MAVLLALGVPLSEALKRVDDAGSRPETDEQRELLTEVSMAVA
jgi:type II secretory pathway component PulF